MILARSSRVAPNKRVFQAKNLSYQDKARARRCYRLYKQPLDQAMSRNCESCYLMESPHTLQTVLEQQPSTGRATDRKPPPAKRAPPARSSFASLRFDPGTRCAAGVLRPAGFKTIHLVTGGRRKRILEQVGLSHRRHFVESSGNMSRALIALP